MNHRLNHEQITTNRPPRYIRESITVAKVDFLFDSFRFNHTSKRVVTLKVSKATNPTLTGFVRDRDKTIGQCYKGSTIVNYVSTNQKQDYKGIKASSDK